MKYRDFREVFKYEFWRQGVLLNTRSVMRMSRAWQELQNAREKRTAFAFFLEEDEGRCREFVFEFNTAEECEKAVKEHNDELLKLGAAKREELAKSQIEKYLAEMKHFAFNYPWT